MILKHCVGCNRDLPEEAFASRKLASKTGLQARCRYCRQKYYFNIKLELLTHYSNGSVRCVCCGEDEIKFLCLDHINGGGSKHRREMEKVSGCSNYSVIRKWCVDNNYPPIFQVLCHNCNMAKAFFGVCPHQEALNG